MANVNHDSGVSGSGITGSGGPVTWSHTCGTPPSGGQGVLLVAVNVDGPDAGITASASYNGVAMTPYTKIEAFTGGQGFLQVFYMLNPPAGAHTVSIAATGGTIQAVDGGSTSFMPGTGFTLGLGTPVTGNTGAISPISIATTSGTSGNLVAAFLAAGNTISSVATGTSSWINNLQGGGGDFTGNSAGAYNSSGSGGATVSWTPASAASYAALAVEVQATSLAAAPIVVSEAGQSYSPTIGAMTAVVNPNGASTTVSFNYGATSSYGSSTGTVATISGLPQLVSSTLTGLSGVGTTVHFQVVATNSFGTTNGADATFTTGAMPTVSGALGASPLGGLGLGLPVPGGAPGALTAAVSISSTVTAAGPTRRVALTSAVAVSSAVTAAGPSSGLTAAVAVSSAVTANVNKAVALTSAVAATTAVTAAGPTSSGGGGTTYRLFPTTNGPTAATSYTGPYGTGTSFEVTASGVTLDGYWWWVCPTGGQSTAAQEFCLYQITGTSTGTLVSGSTVTSGTLSAGWNFIPLSPPLALTSGTPYKAATAWTSSGAGFPYTPGFYGTGGPGVAGITNGPLTAFSDDPGGGGTNPDPFGDNQSTFQVATADPTANYPATGNSSFNGWLDVDVTGGTTGVALTSAVAVSSAVTAAPTRTAAIALTSAVSVSSAVTAAGPSRNGAIALTSAVSVTSAVTANLTGAGSSSTATGLTPIIVLGTPVSLTTQASTVNAGTGIVPLVRPVAVATVPIPGLTSAVTVTSAVTASITSSGGPVPLAPAPIFIRGRGQPPLPPVQYGPRYFTSLATPPVLPGAITSAVSVTSAVTARLSTQVNLTAAVSVTSTVTSAVVSGYFANASATFTATAVGTVSIPAIAITSKVTFDGGSPAITTPFLPAVGGFLIVSYYTQAFSAGTATISDNFGDTGGTAWTPFTNASLTTTTAFGVAYGGWYRQVGTGASSGSITVGVSGWTGGEQILCVDQVTTGLGSLSVPQSNCAKIDFPGTPANGSVTLPSPPAVSSLVWTGSGSGARAVTPTVSSTGFTQLDLVNGATSLASATAYTIGGAPQTVPWQGLSAGQKNSLYALEVALSTSVSSTAVVSGVFTGLANATVSMTATGAATWAFTATALGVVNIAATAAASATFTAAGTGTWFLPATGTAAFGFTATATGTVIPPIAGTAPLTASFTATATGTEIDPSTGVGTLAATFTASAVGTVAVSGTTGALSSTFTASATATVALVATSSLGATFTASAVGTVLNPGNGVGALTASFAAVASATVINPSSGTGALSATFAAVANATLAVGGSGQAGAVFTAVATGTVATPSASTAVASYSFHANAVGTVALAATGSAAFGFNAQAVGIGPAAAIASYGFTALAIATHTTVGTPSEVIQAPPRIITLQAPQRRGAS